MAGMQTGYTQFAGNEFLQGPMANAAVGYGAHMANQGKEYVEKHVCVWAVVTGIWQCDFGHWPNID